MNGSLLLYYCYYGFLSARETDNKIRFSHSEVRRAIGIGGETLCGQIDCFIDVFEGYARVFVVYQFDESPYT